MQQGDIQQELVYLLGLQQACCSKYEEIKDTTSDIQLQDFLEVTTRHIKELIQDLENTIGEEGTAGLVNPQLSSIQVLLQDLNTIFERGSVYGSAKKIAEIEKKLIERYKEVQSKVISPEIRDMLKTHIMTLEEILLQSNVLARLIT